MNKDFVYIFNILTIVNPNIVNILKIYTTYILLSVLQFV